jgi:hypothetical protein
MFILQILKHAPETCPGYGVKPKFRAITVMWFEKIEALAAKHKIKVVGVWVDHPAHKWYAIYETPSMEAFMDLMMEPECMAPLAFCTSDAKPVISAKEALKLIKK